jgi:hypothetical protein
MGYSRREAVVRSVFQLVLLAMSLELVQEAMVEV